MTALKNLFASFYDYIFKFVHLSVTNQSIACGLAIILMTIIIKLILLPLNYKQTISMLKMNELQPEIKKLQDKYKNDPQKSQQEMMKLYKEKGVNPLGGCLPMLLQWPILVAMYFAFNTSTSITNKQFLWMYLDKSSASILKAHGVNLAFILSLILPLLAGITTYISGRLTTATGDSAQAKQASTMNVTMSFVLIFMSWNLKAALVLYWVVSNLFQFAQTMFFKKIKDRQSETNILKN